MLTCYVASKQLITLDGSVKKKDMKNGFFNIQKV